MTRTGAEVPLFIRIPRICADTFMLGAVQEKYQWTIYRIKKLNRIR